MKKKYGLVALFLFFILGAPLQLFASYDLASERDKAIEWVTAQRHGFGWVAVNETSNTGYTYDNALAVIAYTGAGDTTHAKDLLNFLQAHQLTDGCWYDSMNQTTGAGVSLARSSGNQAWVVYAVCFYALRSGDNTFLPMAERASAWIIARQEADGGVTGGLNADGSERTWASTEHNVDSYFAFKLLDYVRPTPSYEAASEGCKNWLLQTAWNIGEGRFNRGANDPVMVLDANSLGALFLKDIQDSVRFGSVLSHIENTYSLTTTRRRGHRITTYTGFKDKVEDEYGFGRHWQEGTEQMAVVYLRDGQAQDGTFYNEEIIKSDDPAFGVGHSDDDNDGDGGKQYYLTGTAQSGLIEQPSSGLWQIFAANETLGDRPKIFFPIPDGNVVHHQKNIYEQQGPHGLRE